MRPRSAPQPHKRDGQWYFIRRVPTEYRSLDPRGLVRLTTGIAIADDPRGIRARTIVEQLDKDLNEYWEALRNGLSDLARQRLDAAQKRARSRGLEYRTAREIAEGELSDLLRRLKMIEGEPDNAIEVTAVLGGEEKPGFLISNMVSEFEKLVATTLIGMSPDQIRKWRNPKLKAAKNLIIVIGEDKEMTRLSRADALKLKRWWQLRVLNEGKTIGAANKDIGHLNKMFRTIDEAYELGLNQIFGKLRLDGEQDETRAAFDAAHVQRIIAGTTLDELNDEARALVWIIAGTGLRPSEACNLDGTTIMLDANAPFVKVRANGRRLKTSQSKREVPLVGCALEAARAFPSGFPRYFNNADALSNLVNGVLDTQGLLPTDKHSLYSFRHTFEDRMTAIEFPDKLAAALMGHKYHRPRYGNGPTIEHKADWLAKIAYECPAFVKRDKEGTRPLRRLRHRALIATTGTSHFSKGGPRKKPLKPEG